MEASGMADNDALSELGFVVDGVATTVRIRCSEPDCIVQRSAEGVQISVPLPRRSNTLSLDWAVYDLNANAYREISDLGSGISIGLFEKGILGQYEKLKDMVQRSSGQELMPLHFAISQVQVPVDLAIDPTQASERAGEGLPSIQFRSADIAPTVKQYLRKHSGDVQVTGREIHTSALAALEDEIVRVAGQPVQVELRWLLDSWEGASARDASRWKIFVVKSNRLATAIAALNAVLRREADCGDWSFPYPMGGCKLNLPIGRAQNRDNPILRDVGCFGQVTLGQYELVPFVCSDVRLDNTVQLQFVPREVTRPAASTAVEDQSEDARKLRQIQEELEAELSKIYGMEEQKQIFREMTTYIFIWNQRAQRLPSSLPASDKRPRWHITLEGPPGTGKTTLARIYAKVLRLCGIANDKFVHIRQPRAELVAGYVGQTTQKVKDAIRPAQPGGVCFIDEAHELVDGSAGGSFGKEAIDTIMADMYPEAACTFIFAGYASKQAGQATIQDLLDQNQGLPRRLYKRIPLQAWTDDELTMIFWKQMKEHFRENVQAGSLERVHAMIRSFDSGLKARFGAGLIENWITVATRHRNARLARRLLSEEGGGSGFADIDPEQLALLTVEDLYSAQSEVMDS